MTKPRDAATLVAPSVLRELLSYDAETGALVWKTRPLKHCRTEAEMKRWNTRFAGKPAFQKLTKLGYLTGTVFDVCYFAHRVAWALHYGVWPDGQIDHINGRQTDNRIGNLRAVTHRENGRNQKHHARNTSGVMGVHWHRRLRKWWVRISVNGARVDLGLFTDFEAACEARRTAEKEYGYHENHGRVA